MCSVVLLCSLLSVVKTQDLCGEHHPQLLSGLPEFFWLWHSHKSCVCLAATFLHVEVFSVFLPAGYHALVSTTCEIWRFFMERFPHPSIL